MPDPTPDPRATVELCEAVQETWTFGPEDAAVDAAKRLAEEALPAIIRDLRRLGVLEAACEATVVAFDRADKEARCYADNWADLRAAAEVARAALAHREGQ